MRKIFITGASGFVGSALVGYLKGKGFDVNPLVRDRKEKGIYWNPEKKEIETQYLEEAFAFIHLSGESIIGRWTQNKRDKIRTSRLQTTEFLCETIALLKKKPEVYIGASAIGYYGNRGQELLTEESSSGKGFLAKVCAEWENIPEQLLSRKKIRTVATRFGIVLGKGGALKNMAVPFKLGLGGRMGSGHQMISWIAIEDLCRAMHHVLEHAELKGPINFVSPNPVTNQEFTAVLGKTLHRPTLFPIPAWLLKSVFGKGAEIFLSSERVYPEKLLQSGFSFKYPLIQAAIKKHLKFK